MNFLRTVLALSISALALTGGTAYAQRGGGGGGAHSGARSGSHAGQGGFGGRQFGGGMRAPPAAGGSFAGRGHGSPGFVGGRTGWDRGATGGQVGDGRRTWRGDAGRDGGRASGGASWSGGGNRGGGQTWNGGRNRGGGQTWNGGRGWGGGRTWSGGRGWDGRRGRWHGYGPSFPLGLYVAALPLAFTTLWIGSSLYYYDYAQGVYYAPAATGGYTIVAPPPGAEPAPYESPDQSPDQGAAEAPSTAPNPIFYPRNGQSAEQTEADRQACNRWAATQQSALADAAIFQRAVAACMDGRGYTVG